MSKIIRFPTELTGSQLERLLKASVQRALAFETHMRSSSTDGTPARIGWDVPIARFAHVIAEAGLELIVDAQGVLVIRRQQGRTPR